MLLINALIDYTVMQWFYNNYLISLTGKISVTMFTHTGCQCLLSIQQKFYTVAAQ